MAEEGVDGVGEIQVTPSSSILSRCCSASLLGLSAAPGRLL